MRCLPCPIPSAQTVSLLFCRTPVRRRRSPRNKAPPSPASHPRSAAATSGDCGPCRSRPRARLRGNRRSRTLPARRDIPAPGIASSDDEARASRSSFRVTTMPRGDFSFNVFSVDCASSEPSRCSAATMSSIRSWANQRSISAASPRPGPRSRRSQTVDRGFTSAESTPGGDWSGRSRKAASLPEGTTASAKRA